MKYNMQLNGYIHTHITEHLLAPFNEIIPELIRIFQSSLPSTSQFGKIACISIPFVFHIALLNVENFSTLILNNISLVSKLLSFNLYDKNLNTLCLKRHFFTTHCYITVTWDMFRMNEHYYSTRQRARELTNGVFHFGIINKLNAIENCVSNVL